MTHEELNDKTTAMLGTDIDQLIEQVRVLGTAYGKRKARVKYMENVRKTCLHGIIEDRRAEFNEAGEKITESRLESIARASKDYKDFLESQYKEEIALAELEAEYFAERNRLDSTLEKMKLLRSEQYFHSKN